jgi:hypothetical protein
MPRLVTPLSNPFSHGSHTLTPYSRRQRDTTSPTDNNDKENEPPEAQPTKILASQAALRNKLREQPDTQYYDPFQPREKVRDTIQSYRRLIQDTTGISRQRVIFPLTVRMSNGVSQAWQRWNQGNRRKGRRNL